NYEDLFIPVSKKEYIEQVLIKENNELKFIENMFPSSSTGSKSPAEIQKEVDEKLAKFDKDMAELKKMDPKSAEEARVMFEKMIRQQYEMADMNVNPKAMEVITGKKANIARYESLLNTLPASELNSPAYVSHELKDNSTTLDLVEKSENAIGVVYKNYNLIKSNQKDYPIKFIAITGLSEEYIVDYPEKGDENIPPQISKFLVKKRYEMRRDFKWKEFHDLLN
ncbi:MAG: hypothetical protein OEY34_06955, partial [Cyclobacteriaceae bacterium]|nr:hypothetical protein [Cyclobacteriaceae bacterium]